MKIFPLLLSISLAFTNLVVSASNTKKLAIPDISHLISKDEFSSYQDVADFIEKSPKVTVVVSPSQAELEEYGQHAKSLTGSDCDRDGKMDDNASCNAVFFKLWMKYSR